MSLGWWWLVHSTCGILIPCRNIICVPTWSLLIIHVSPLHFFCLQFSFLPERCLFWPGIREEAQGSSSRGGQVTLGSSFKRDFSSCPKDTTFASFPNMSCSWALFVSLFVCFCIFPSLSLWGLIFWELTLSSPKQIVLPYFIFFYLPFTESDRRTQSDEGRGGGGLHLSH